MTATKNSCISFLRKQAGKTFIQPENTQVHTLTDEVVPTWQDDPANLINKALLLLPPQCLAIFKLSRFANLTYQQIADEMGLSVKTVENQIGKALRIMRDYAKKNNISLLLIAFITLIFGNFSK